MQKIALLLHNLESAKFSEARLREKDSKKNKFRASEWMREREREVRKWNSISNFPEKLKSRRKEKLQEKEREREFKEEKRFPKLITTGKKLKVTMASSVLFFTSTFSFFLSFFSFFLSFYRLKKLLFALVESVIVRYPHNYPPSFSSYFNHISGTARTSLLIQNKRLCFC